VAPAQNAQALVDAREQPGDGGLAGSGVAQKTRWRPGSGTASPAARRICCTRKK
jgi:hypothetical protein